ncbi:hypothetical protein TWF225_006948 [Orbilia oligospora]|uniref:Uncharacterized protein n=1 Tax=Orbilia oligospora TaxID=2813651 RepID=A0A7C8U5X6_ORBOL|nr:hypothetical protein TWF751_008315 [Orbilia oligospora]KAF3194403.1 hypothetical protein TWF225_006948 [Orbilia oligospora]KAF3246172.1 hypothetical protein TWF128_008988 [Orbilia oligospora]KAF3264154.1 hypothetical protein TWF217_003308 [Orbilia oligospora]KAF3296093.1 hypothetical protein TWF132_011561 [Orbilia oligospora]
MTEDKAAAAKGASQLMQDALSNGKGEMPIACERCRRRKQKCDRKLPSCSNCSKSGHQCNVPDVTDRRRAAGAQSARLPKGYIEQLEAQVRFLESNIQEKLSSLREQHGTPESQPSKRLKLDDGAASWQDRYMQGRMELDGEENLLMLSATASMTHASSVNSQMELPAPAIHHDVSTLPTMSILSLSNIGDSNESGPFTFSKVLSSIIRSDGRNPALSTRINPFFTDLADAIPHVLPDMASQLSGSTGRKHMDKYFRMVQFRYRVLDRKDIEEYYEGWVNRQSKQMARAESVSSARSALQEDNYPGSSATSQAGGPTQAVSGDGSGSHPDSPIKNFIIYMVLAIGITLDEDSASHSAFFSNHFLFAAIRHFEAVLEGSEGSNVGTDDPIDTIRALLLLAIYSLYSPSAGPTWHFIGLAIRKAICLGYHMDMVQGEDGGPVDERVQEERRWVFWTAYVLDRCICQALDRPFSIQDTDVTAKLPTLSKENPLDVFALHFIRYNLIRTDFMTHPTKNFTYHQTNLLSWRQSFPVFPPSIDQVLRDTIRDYFDGLYYGALLLLIKPNEKYRPVDSSPLTPSNGLSLTNSSMQTSQDHRKLSHIAFASIYVLRSAAKRVELSSFISWLIGYRVFKAGLVFLRSVLILSSFRRRYCTVEQVSSDLGSAMDVLTAVGSKFDDLKRYRGVFRILKRGFEKFLEAEKMGTRPPQFSTSDIDFSVVNIGTLKSLLEEVVEMLCEMSSIPPAPPSNAGSERERSNSGLVWNNGGNNNDMTNNGMRVSVSKPFGNGALMTPPLTTPTAPGGSTGRDGMRSGSAPAATPGAANTYPHHNGANTNRSPKGNANGKQGSQPNIMGMTDPTAVSVKWGNSAADIGGMAGGATWNGGMMGMGMRGMPGGYTAPSVEMDMPDKDLYEILFGGGSGGVGV